MHVNHTNGERKFQIQIEKYAKKTNSQSFSNPESSITLDEDAVIKLLNYLQLQQSLGKIELGSKYIAFPVDDSKTFNQKQLQDVGRMLQGLLKNGQISTLVSLGAISKEALENIGAATQQASYKAAVKELRQLIETEKDESVFQKWFEEHPWLLGTHYIEKVDNRTIGLHEVADIIMRTTDGYLDLFELKRPDKEVLRLDTSRKCYCFSADTSQAIAQAAHYIAKTEANRNQLAQEDNLLFLKPRARIIIGRSNTWDQKMRDALRILNGALHFIEIWTYDYLIAMAERMVKFYEKGTLSHVSREKNEVTDISGSDSPF